jgi:hypothetical protein
VRGDVGIRRRRHEARPVGVLRGARTGSAGPAGGGRPTWQPAVALAGQKRGNHRRRRTRRPRSHLTCPGRRHDTCPGAGGQARGYDVRGTSPSALFSCLPREGAVWYRRLTCRRPLRLPGVVAVAASPSAFRCGGCACSEPREGNKSRFATSRVAGSYSSRCNLYL